MNLADASSNSAGSTAGTVIFIIIGIAAYWAPTLIAWIRHVPNAGSVTVINAFLGWTFVGWIVALAMACRSHAPQLTVTQTVNVDRPLTPTLPPAPPETTLGGYR